MTYATTLERTLRPGEVLRAGSKAAYRRLAAAPGEARTVRDELGTGGKASRTSRSLLFLAQVTDLQLADVQSPGRFEFFESLRGQPGDHSFVPAQRPQESFAFHALEAMSRSLGRISNSQETGAELGLVVFTGDSLDNAQLNELEWFTRLLVGGDLRPFSGGSGYEGVQAAGWPSELYWHPDAGSDRWKSELGFPDVPGALEVATATFRTAGLSVPWISCFGNHDGLVLGGAIPNEAYRSFLVADRKPVALPAGAEVLGREEDFFAHPETYLAGPSRAVEADLARRAISRREFVSAHLDTPGLPAGHGFARKNLDDGTAYGVYDWSDEIRFVLLDTTNLDGHFDGSLGDRQLRWLEEQLAEVHSSYLSDDGRLVSTANRDRLVVLASHHGPASLTNLRCEAYGLEEDHPRCTADQVTRVLERFPNVVLWLSGHRHVNDVVLRKGIPDGSPGFWDVATAALADWPCQARLVELLANPDGTLSILCTMLDHHGPAEPVSPDGAGAVEWLASLHRELAANVPGAGAGSYFEGSLVDRNVELVLPAPSWLG